MRGWGKSGIKSGRWGGAPWAAVLRLSRRSQIFLPTNAFSQGRNNLGPPELTVPVPVAPGTGSPGASLVLAATNAAGRGAAGADDPGRTRRTFGLGSLWPRRAGYQRRPDLAGLCREGGRDRDVPSREGGQERRRRPSRCRRATMSFTPASDSPAPPRRCNCAARQCAKSLKFRPAPSGSKAASAMCASPPGRYRSTSSRAASSTPASAAPSRRTS